MSKYNRFAKDLDAAFKTSRDAYAKAYSQYAQAERAAKDAQRRAPMIPIIRMRCERLKPK